MNLLNGTDYGHATLEPSLSKGGVKRPRLRILSNIIGGLNDFYFTAMSLISPDPGKIRKDYYPYRRKGFYEASLLS